MTVRRAGRRREEGDPYRIVGQRLRLARRLRDMSQGQLAELLGVTYQQIQKYETGKNKISLVPLIRACGILGIDPHVLIAEVADWMKVSGVDPAGYCAPVSMDAIRLGVLARSIVGTRDADIHAAGCSALETLLKVGARGRGATLAVNQSEAGDLVTIVISDRAPTRPPDDLGGTMRRARSRKPHAPPAVSGGE